VPAQVAMMSGRQQLTGLPDRLARRHGNLSWRDGYRIANRRGLVPTHGDAPDLGEDSQPLMGPVPSVG
jgi:hypothetical protein